MKKTTIFILSLLLLCSAALAEAPAFNPDLQAAIQAALEEAENQNAENQEAENQKAENQEAKNQKVENPVPVSQEAAQKAQLLQAAKEANLRRLPTVKSDLLERVKKGARIEVLSTSVEDGETWARVRVRKSGREGYMLMELLEPVPTPTPTPEPTPVPTATPEPTPSPVPTPSPIPGTLAGETVYEETRLARTTSRVNLRKKPDGDLVTKLSGTETLTVTGEIMRGDELWLHVKAESGFEGYVLSDFTRQIQPAVLIPVSEEAVRGKYAVVSCDPLGDLNRIKPFSYTEEELSAYTTLREGDVCEAVLDLRKQLYNMGYYVKPNETTLYTESTADVIRTFQEDCGLPVTGEADPHTQAMLYDERTPKKPGSPNELLYLNNKRDAALFIQKAEVTSYRFSGSIQLSLQNNSGGRLTRFALKIIPYWTNGDPAYMADTFAEEIEREYTLDDISIGIGNTYSDFATNGLEEDLGLWPHHFEVSRKVYFTGAQLAVCSYRSGGRNVYIDDDQMIFIEAGAGAGDSHMRTLPIEVTEEERAEAHKWAMGIVSRYVLPVYQQHYSLPQGAWLKTVYVNSPASDAGLQEGDVIVGIGDITILGDATLRKARASIAPGESAALTFWRDGVYYETEIMRPAEPIE